MNLNVNKLCLDLYNYPEIKGFYDDLLILINKLITRVYDSKVFYDEKIWLDFEIEIKKLLKKNDKRDIKVLYKILEIMKDSFTTKEKFKNQDMRIKFYSKQVLDKIENLKGVENVKSEN